MADFPFAHYRNRHVTITPNGLELDDRRLRLDETLEFGPPAGAVAMHDLARAAEAHTRLTGGACHAQIAALAFAAGATRALDWYFPLSSALDPDEIDDFYRLIADLISHPRLDLRLIGEGRVDMTGQLPLDSRALIAGHLAEIFFYRRDILDRLLNTPRRFRLYATARAFEQDGGVAGGDYNPAGECIQLLLSRLYEGFSGPTPGVAPFLHEFGHMLDFFDVATGRMDHSAGLLPGLSPADGAIYTPDARRLFLHGKRLELDRYLHRYHGHAAPDEPLPIGHPYVFQNDTEFIAGYLEMFFRNPHSFAAQNPALYEGFMVLFRQDPRRAWAADFPFYVEENRKFYLSGQRPWEPGLSVPEA
ncbi:MAG: zinc-dependent peptidase [Roseiflexaceae bacterium]